MATSITHFGATWTFSENRQTGTFLNGEPWVVGPVTVTAITPTNQGGEWTNDELLAWRGVQGQRAWIPTLDYAPNEAGADETAPNQGWTPNPYSRTLGVDGFLRLWPVGKRGGAAYTASESPYTITIGSKSSGSMIIERPNRLHGLYPETLYAPGLGDFKTLINSPTAPTPDWQSYLNPSTQEEPGQGWAGPMATYYDLSRDKSLTANLPFTLSAGQILITAIGKIAGAPLKAAGSPEADVNVHPFGGERINAHVALTVITADEAARAPTSFRPALYNYDADTQTTPPRAIVYDQDDISFDFLKNITIPVGLETTHTQQDIEASLPALPWWEYSDTFWQTDRGGVQNTSTAGFNGNVTSNSYGVEIGHKWANTITWLNLRHHSDDAQNNAIKRKALIQVIQCSLDVLSFIKAGGLIIGTGGGHKGGRKLMAFTAGQALNVPALLQIAGRKDVFGEGFHTHVVRQAYLNDTSWNTTDRYTLEELGIADWNTCGPNPRCSSKLFNWSNYRSVWNNFNATIMVADFLGMHAIWNDDISFAYMERMIALGAGPPNGYVNSVATSLTQVVGGNSNSPRFYIGRKIVTNKPTIVHSLPNNGSTTSFLVPDKIGTIIGGPVNISNVNWWQIRYKNGPTAATSPLTGWSPQTDITKMPQKAFTNTIPLNGGIFEPGKQLAITAPKTDASVYYSVALPIQSISYIGDWPSATQTVTIVSPGHGIPLGSTFDAVLSGIQNTFQQPGYAQNPDTLNGTTQTLSVINANTLTFPTSYLVNNISVTNGKFLPYPGDYDIDGIPIVSRAGKIGTTSYSLPAGDTTFSIAVVREGYDMSNIVSSTFRIDSSGKPVQPSQLKIIS